MKIKDENHKIIHDYVESKRPDPELRREFDLGYIYDVEEIIMYEISPHWNNENITDKHLLARVKYNKSGERWEVYNMKSNGKWELYKYKNEVENIVEFVELVEEDEHNCFWG